MYGRRYRAPISIGSTSAQIDIFELIAGTSTPLALMGFSLGQISEVGDAQEEQLQLVLKYAFGSVTTGSGGGTSTPRPVLPNDSAATVSGVTFKTGNTTKLAAGTGTVQELERFAWNLRSDFPQVWIPEMWQGCAAGARLVLELVTSPGDPILGIVGAVHFAELI
jgi:hypothetical protein